MSPLGTAGPVIGVSIVVAIVIVAILYQIRQQQHPLEGATHLPFLAWFFLGVLFRPILPLMRGLLLVLQLGPSSRWAKEVRTLLDAAGLYTIAEEDMVASQILAGLGVTFIMVMVTGNLALSLALGMTVTIYTFALLRRLTEERKQLIFAELPYILDLLSLGIEAGLDFKASIDRLVNFSEPSPLINELKAFTTDLNLGEPMETALQKMRRRIDILAFFSFIEALIQATQMGIDVSSTLRAQAEQMRISYFQAVEKSANKLPLMILFPSVIGIFPPLILVTIGPVMMQIRDRLIESGAAS